MSEFEREDRYVVFKRKHIANLSVAGQQEILNVTGEYAQMLSGLGIPNRPCVVVEDDWPEYDVVWKMIERRMSPPSTKHFDPCTVVVFLAPTPEEAPIYDRALVLLDIDGVIVVGQGTVAGKPTIDFQLVDSAGTRYVAMMSGALLDTLSRAIRAMQPE